MNNPEDKVVEKFTYLMEDKSNNWIYSQYKWLDVFLKNSPHKVYQKIEIIGCYKLKKKFLKIFPIYGQYCIVKFYMSHPNKDEYVLYINDEYIRICDSSLYKKFSEKAEYLIRQCCNKYRESNINSLLK